MARLLRILGLLCAAATLGIWLFLGAYTGWSQTQVPTRKIDPITEIEFTEYEKRFVPGLDFLGGGFAIACALLAASILPNIFHKPKPMKNTSLIALATTSLMTFAYAETVTFDFKDPKGVNNVVFRTDAPLESINGTATGVSGTVTVDFDKPEEIKGKIIVTTESLNVPNPMMKEHLLGEQWLDASKYPEITFELKKVDDIEEKESDPSKGQLADTKVSGTFTLHGVSKEITVPAKITYLPGRLADRTMGKVQGDLLVVRSEFTIKRSEYGIKPGQNLDSVSDDINISLSIAGAAPKK